MPPTLKVQGSVPLFSFKEQKQQQKMHYDKEDFTRALTKTSGLTFRTEKNTAACSHHTVNVPMSHTFVPAGRSTVKSWFE